VSTPIVVAYVPVLHDGYRRFFEAHRGPIRVVDDDLIGDDRPLAKDIRRLAPTLVVDALVSWGFDAAVLDLGAIDSIGESEPLVLPAEDVSYRLVEQHFARNPVTYDTVFLRWDKTRTAQLLRPADRPGVTSATEPEAALRLAGEHAAALSVDWWRRVGAAMRVGDEIYVATNRHLPHEWSPYAVGDPRANFFKGVHLELSTAVHAEAQLVANAAREGVATAGAVVYVTDFPCPPCAKLLAGAGIATLYYRDGYAVVDGQDVLEAAGVEIVRVT